MEEQKIMEHEPVVDEYRVSDVDKRLSMFLYYRELREEFAHIEERISNVLVTPRYQSWLRRLIPLLRSSCPPSIEYDFEKPHISSGAAK